MNERQLLEKFKQLATQYLGENFAQSATKQSIINVFANIESPGPQDAINYTTLLTILEIITKEWGVSTSAINWNDIN